MFVKKEDDENAFDKCLRCIKNMFQKKVITNEKDVFAVVLYGLVSTPWLFSPNSMWSNSTVDSSTHDDFTDSELSPPPLLWSSCRSVPAIGQSLLCLVILFLFGMITRFSCSSPAWKLILQMEKTTPMYKIFMLLALDSDISIIFLSGEIKLWWRKIYLHSSGDSSASMSAVDACELRTFAIELLADNLQIISSPFILYVNVSDEGWSLTTKSLRLQIIYNMPDRKNYQRKKVHFTASVWLI